MSREREKELVKNIIESNEIIHNELSKMNTMLNLLRRSFKLSLTPALEALVKRIFDRVIVKDENSHVVAADYKQALRNLMENDNEIKDQCMRCGFTISPKNIGYIEFRNTVEQSADRVVNYGNKKVFLGLAIAPEFSKVTSDCQDAEE